MQTNTRNRGFASMDSEKQREIARKGGRAAHAKGTAHEFSSNEARAAGRKGGERVSANREHMSRIGRIGGKNSAGRRAADRGSPDNGGSNTSPGAPAARPPQYASHPGDDRDARMSAGDNTVGVDSHMSDMDDGEGSGQVNMSDLAAARQNESQPAIPSPT